MAVRSQIDAATHACAVTFNDASDDRGVAVVENHATTTTNIPSRVSRNETVDQGGIV